MRASPGLAIDMVDAGVEVPVQDGGPANSAMTSAGSQKWPKRKLGLAALRNANPGHHRGTDDRAEQHASHDRHRTDTPRNRPRTPASLTSPMPIPRG